MRLKVIETVETIWELPDNHFDEYDYDEEDFVEEVRDLVEQGMPVMEAVQQVCRLVGCKGRDLMRAYTEAYR